MHMRRIDDHNATQKRKAEEMGANEDRVRCRTCEKLLPRKQFSITQLEEKLALVRRCRKCAEKYDSQTRRKQNEELAMQCAKCDQSVPAHAEHITKKQKENARTLGSSILCAECVADGITVNDLEEYTCTMNDCRYGRNAFVNENGEAHTKKSFDNARRRGKLVCIFCHTGSKHAEAGSSQT